MITYKLSLVVAKIFEHKKLRHMHGVGKEAVFEEISDGWYVAFEESFEAVRFGEDKPAWEVGDVVDVTFRKRQ